MRRLDTLYLGTNTKMFKTKTDTLDYLAELASLFSALDSEGLFTFVLPSFIALESAVSAVRGSGIHIGAQNLHWERSGQFTGEISAPMLTDLGVEMAMIGHSERRHTMGESDEMVAQKLSAALNEGISALLCVGESAAEKTCSLSREILSIQLKKSLGNVSEKDAARLMVAYEPVWAIGVNGVPAKEEYVDSMHAFIKGILTELFPVNGGDIPVLYGGSVNQENAVALISQKNVDGLFIGRSAWDARSFFGIAKEVIPAFHKKRW